MLPLTQWSIIVDLDYLYHRHQFSLFMAEHADCEQASQIHREFGERYAARIAETALTTVAEHSDDDVRCIDPLSLRR